MQEEKAPKDHVIIKEGDLIDSILLIVKGEVILTKKFSSEDCVMAYNNFGDKHCGKTRGLGKEKLLQRGTDAYNIKSSISDYYLGCEFIDVFKLESLSNIKFTQDIEICKVSDNN